MAIELSSSSTNSPDSDIITAHHADGHGHPSSRKQQQQQQQRPRTKLSSLSILGLFIFYIGHDALQERIFRLDGFEYGFFMTLIEVAIMLLLASSIMNTHGNGDEDSVPPPPPQSRKGKIKYPSTTTTTPPLSTATIVRIAWVGLLLALAHGLGNTSLNYSPYPLKLAFKSCKLLPTMAVGACFTYDRRYTALQYTAALIMGFGLAVLSSADTTSSSGSSSSLITSIEEPSLRILVADENDTLHNNNNNNNNNSSSSWHDAILPPHLGMLLLAISTALDSAVPNIQEQLLRSKRVHTSDMIRISNGVMCACLAVYTYLSGELYLAWNYCARRKEASVMLLLQGICAYFGLRCYLSIIREYGGVVGVLLANARKLITIVLSFVLFSKPFNEHHVAGLMLVGVGVYLGYVSKSTKEKKDKGQRKKVDDEEENNNITKATADDKDRVTVTLSNGEEEANKFHEHSV